MEFNFSLDLNEIFEFIVFAHLNLMEIVVFVLFAS